MYGFRLPRILQHNVVVDACTESREKETTKFSLIKWEENDRGLGYAEFPARSLRTYLFFSVIFFLPLRFSFPCTRWPSLLAEAQAKQDESNLKISD